MVPDGDHLPRGTWIGASVIGVHMNDGFYPKPDECDPFRFSRARTEPFLHGKKQEKENIALATTSEVFLAFGHGRHS